MNNGIRTRFDSIAWKLDSDRGNLVKRSVAAGPLSRVGSAACPSRAALYYCGLLSNLTLWPSRCTTTSTLQSSTSTKSCRVRLTRQRCGNEVRNLEIFVRVERPRSKVVHQAEPKKRSSAVGRWAFLFALNTAGIRTGRREVEEVTTPAVSSPSLFPSLACQSTCPCSELPA